MFVSLKGRGLIGVVFSILLLFLMTTAFLAGWGRMLKSAVTDCADSEPNSIIKDFAPGVGEYFIPACGLLGVICLINILVLVLSYIAGIHFIGHLGISADAFAKAFVSIESLKLFVASLTAEQIIKINLWNMLLIASIAVTYFILMFCYPALYFDTKNPLKAIFLSVKHIFSRKLLVAAGIYLLIFFINIVISLCFALTAGNVILNFIMTLTNFYFISCVAIGIFYYYNETFIKLHLGKSIDKYV